MTFAYGTDGSIIDIAALVRAQATATINKTNPSSRPALTGRSKATNASHPPVIAGIASDGRGGWVVLQTGSDGRTSLFGLWQVSTGTREARLLAGPEEIGRASGLGGLIDLDDGTLTNVGDDVVLALAGPGGSAVISLEGRALAGGQARLTRLFSTPTEDGQPWGVRPGDVWFGRPDGSLNLLRPATGQLWTVDPAGAMTAWPATAGRPATGVPPLDLPHRPSADGLATQWWFYPDTLTADEALAPAADVAVRYPALVQRRGSQDTVFDRDALVVRPGFPTHALRISAWCVDPAGGDVLAWDAMSGEVFRVTLGTR